MRGIRDRISLGRLLLRTVVEEDVTIVVKRDVMDIIVVLDHESLVTRMDPGDQTHQGEDLDERLVQQTHHAQINLTGPILAVDLVRISGVVVLLLRELNVRTIEREGNIPARDLEVETKVDVARLLGYHVTSILRVFARMERTVNLITM